MLSSRNLNNDNSQQPTTTLEGEEAIKLRGASLRSVEPLIKSVSATGSVSTISKREKRCFIMFINSVMSKRLREMPQRVEETIGEWQPISVDNLETSNELYGRLSDGLIFM